MEETHRDIEQGNKSVYAEKGDVTVNNYGADGKKINKHLGILPPLPTLFIGRNESLQKVHDLLFSGENVLLLVNGEGGFGKTTFAA